ncbi:ATP-binding protein [Streptomyces sp. NPDC058653]|uniref:sensor histidine kinase n=1 Tax=Streptomyces sp. NPDC058653 TaxID=3346576 RepID=UPI00364F9D20
MKARLPWSLSSVRLRLLAGLALLLVGGLVASATISAILLESFLDERDHDTLRSNAERVARVMERAPQTVDADQLGALLDAPLGTVLVDNENQVLLSTGSAKRAADALAVLSTTVPTGSVSTLDGENLSLVRIPSPGLTVPRGSYGVMRPAAVVLSIDTSVDDATTNALIARQLSLIGLALVVLLALSIAVLRFGMRPLAQMARTADAIAAGSLTERLPTHRNGSEADQLARAVNQAFDAQARAEAGIRSLAADTSHELRTPLSTISGWLDLHRQGGLSGPGLESALEHIETEVGRMRLLVEDLALLARLDAGRPVEQEAVDLAALADGVIDDAQIIYPQRDIAMAPAPPAPVVGDALRLQQVLRNLVGNAVQHTPEHTSVRVEITAGPQHVRLSVTDDGPGIAPEDLPRVFERFWRAEASRSRAYGGSGLGLAIVEAIVHAHRGDVTVRSAPGAGTTVTVHLSRA